MPDECHISSLIVHVRPECEAVITTEIGRLEGAELQPQTNPGKLIVTLETASTAEIIERLNAIHDLAGVIFAALIYHHWEPASEHDAAAESEAHDESVTPQVSQG